MQGISYEKEGIIVLAVTNSPWILDPAIRKNFKKMIYFPLPDVEARKDLFRINLGKDVLHSITPEEINAFTALTEG